MKGTTQVVFAMAADGEALTFPLMTSDGVPSRPEDAFGDDGKVMLHGQDAFHPDVIVCTTKPEIEAYMSLMTTMDKAKHLFRLSWDEIKHADSDALFAKGGREWKHFINSIVVYYCARWKVFGKPMPAINDAGLKKVATHDMCVEWGKGKTAEVSPTHPRYPKGN